MSELNHKAARPTLLDGSRADLAGGVLPRVPEFPASNYTYMKRAEAMRAEAEAGRVAGLQHVIQQVAGSNTYARVCRAYGGLLLEHLDREAQLAAAVAVAEAQVAEAIKPKGKAKPAKRVSFEKSGEAA